MINLQYQDMPYKVHGLIRANEDGSFTIILNSRDTREQNLRAYEHELRHILHDDMHADDVQSIEARAHGGHHGKEEKERHREAPFREL